MEIRGYFLCRPCRACFVRFDRTVCNFEWIQMSEVASCHNHGNGRNCKKLCGLLFSDV